MGFTGRWEKFLSWMGFAMLPSKPALIPPTARRHFQGTNDGWVTVIVNVLLHAPWNPMISPHPHACQWRTRQNGIRPPPHDGVKWRPSKWITPTLHWEPISEKWWCMLYNFYLFTSGRPGVGKQLGHRRYFLSLIFLLIQLSVEEHYLLTEAYIEEKENSGGGKS